MIGMDSNVRLRELFEYIRSIEERAEAFYERLLTRIQDPEVAKSIAKMRNEEAGHVQIAEELLKILKKYEGISTQISPRLGQKIVSIKLYILAGILLGLGAPVGSIAFRFVVERGADFANWLYTELSSHRGYYLYITIGALSAFTLSGWIVGLIHRRLVMKAENLSVQARILEDVSEKDPLTGLHNFRYIQERLAVELERSRRFQTPLSCLMVDVDRLKWVNDTYGHPFGDMVLRRIAGIIQKEIRIVDTATRYGGDEFFLILPVTSKAGAYVVADRIRTKVKEAEIRSDQISFRPTASIGIAAFPSPDIHDQNDLVEAADSALYEAKRGGKDRSAVIA